MSIAVIDQESVAKRGAFTFEDLPLGTRFTQQYAATEEVYRRFLDLFGDVSPLHVSDEVAVSCGFSRRLVHGATLNGFISNFVGMNFPGRRSLELGVDIEYVQPTYIGDVLLLEATVKERLEARCVVVLKFRFTRGDTLIARGRITVMMCDVP